MEKETKEMELSKKADELLAKAGYTIWGEPKEKKTYAQQKFEREMPICPYRGAGR